MMKLAFIHRGSATAKMIMAECGIPRWGRRCRADLLINYGIAGGQFEDWRARNPLGRRLPMFNKPLTMNKYDVIKAVSNQFDATLNVPVPETRRFLDERHSLAGWLEKPFYSQQGRGISLATCYNHNNKYYQQYIHNRVYELRIHAFNWIPFEEWPIQKRVQGEESDAITWNHHTGGTFITVNDRNQRVFQEAIKHSSEVLHVLGMQFGGVDFIVNRDREVLFIEINSAVGCHGLSDPIYINAFNRLQEMRREEIVNYV